MSSKVIGALLILGAGGGLLVQLWRQSRAEILFLQDMASALEQMEAAIRFRRLPMPELLREQAERSCCGSMFSLILQHMERGFLDPVRPIHTMDAGGGHALRSGTIR